MSLPVTANGHAVSQTLENAAQAKSPAKAAREFLAANPDAPTSENSFGKMVMEFAKGETRPDCSCALEPAAQPS